MVHEQLMRRTAHDVRNSGRRRVLFLAMGFLIFAPNAAESALLPCGSQAVLTTDVDAVTPQGRVDEAVPPALHLDVNRATESTLHGGIDACIHPLFGNIEIPIG